MSWSGNGRYWGPRPAGPATTAASGWWDARTQMQYQRAGAWPTTGPASLLFMSFTSGLIDESASNNSIGTVGTVTLDSETGSASFAANSALTIATPHSLTLAGDFTVEAWLNLPALGTFRILAAPAVGAEAIFQCAVISNGALLFSCTGSGGNNNMTASGSPLMTTNTWRHLAFVRNNSEVKAYLDGQWLGVTVTGITAELLTTQSLSFPRASVTFGNVAGNLDDLRVTASALYTANFTPPARSAP